jgi:hypothetical protein
VKARTAALSEATTPGVFTTQPRSSGQPWRRFSQFIAATKNDSFFLWYP